MILDKEVLIRWNPRGLKHYLNKGYIFTHWKDEFLVKIEDLSNSSSIMVNVQCDNCGDIGKVALNNYKTSTNNMSEKYYCRNCRHIKIKEYYLKNFGVENGFQLEKNKEKARKTKLKKYGNENYRNDEKIKQTTLKKYGVENISQLESIKKQKEETCLKNFGVVAGFADVEKRSKTNLEKFGYTCVLQSEKIKDKIKKTNLDKYGYTCVLQSEKIKDKIKKTNLDKYGFENPNQNEKIRNKSKQTCLEKFGVETPFQNENVKIKIRKTLLEKFGVENVSQSKDIKKKKEKTCLKNYGVKSGFADVKKREQTSLERYGNKNYTNLKKARQTCLKKYGVEHASQLPEIIEKQIQTCIDRYGEAFFLFIPKYNPLSISYIDFISQKTNLHFQHGVNGGEKKLHRYWVDGYNEEYNIVIEIDEKHHEKQKDKDIKREKYIKENFGCHIIRINWENIDNEIDDVVKIINNIKNNDGV